MSCSTSGTVRFAIWRRQTDKVTCERSDMSSKIKYFKKSKKSYKYLIKKNWKVWKQVSTVNYTF